MQMSFTTRFCWYRDLVSVLLRKELSVRYKNSVLGYLWSLMNPLATACVFYVVFGLYMRFDTPNYIIVLLSALFPWQWFNNSVGQAPFAFLANASLVKKVAFPRHVLPLVTTLHDMVHFLLALPVLILFMYFHGLYPGWIWLYGVPLLLIVSLITFLGLSLIVSSVNLFFRDLGNLVVIILNILFYATPIIYPFEKVPAQYVIYFKINPVAPVFIAWRSLLYENKINPEFLFLAILYALLFGVIGCLVFRHLSTRFAEAI